MAKTMPVPDLDALGDFALAAVRNARRLLDDADLLLRRGRWPSAYSLAVLAFEEAGKAWMCIIAMMVPDDVRPEWPYGDLITTDVDKLMAAHVMAHMLASATSGRDMITDLADVGENLEELAREHNHAKQRGLYADLLDDTVWEPASVTPDEARRMVVTVMPVTAGTCHSVRPPVSAAGCGYRVLPGRTGTSERTWSERRCEQV
jgi:AbiV family abortive infection protein